MGHPISEWKNKRIKKLKSRTYRGTYQWARLKGKRNKERMFVLSCRLRTGTKHNLTFESHEHARSEGWYKANAVRVRKKK